MPPSAFSHFVLYQRQHHFPSDFWEGSARGRHQRKTSRWLKGRSHGESWFWAESSWVALCPQGTDFWTVCPSWSYLLSSFHPDPGFHHQSYLWIMTAAFHGFFSRGNDFLYLSASLSPKCAFSPPAPCSTKSLHQTVYAWHSLGVSCVPYWTLIDT